MEEGERNKYVVDADASDMASLPSDRELLTDKQKATTAKQVAIANEKNAAAAAEQWKTTGGGALAREQEAVTVMEEREPVEMDSEHVSYRNLAYTASVLALVFWISWLNGIVVINFIKHVHEVHGSMLVGYFNSTAGMLAVFLLLPLIIILPPFFARRVSRIVASLSLISAAIFVLVVLVVSGLIWMSMVTAELFQVYSIIIVIQVSVAVLLLYHLVIMLRLKISMWKNRTKPKKAVLHCCHRHIFDKKAINNVSHSDNKSLSNVSRNHRISINNVIRLEDTTNNMSRTAVTINNGSKIEDTISTVSRTAKDTMTNISTGDKISINTGSDKTLNITTTAAIEPGCSDVSAAPILASTAVFGECACGDTPGAVSSTDAQTSVHAAKLLLVFGSAVLSAHGDGLVDCEMHSCARVVALSPIFNVLTPVFLFTLLLVVQLQHYTTTHTNFYTRTRAAHRSLQFIEQFSLSPLERHLANEKKLTARLIEGTFTVNMYRPGLCPC